MAAMRVLATGSAMASCCGGLTALEVSSSVAQLSLRISELPLTVLQGLLSAIQCCFCSLQDGHNLISTPSFNNCRCLTSQMAVQGSLCS